VMALSSLSWNANSPAPNEFAKSSVLNRRDEELLRSEKDSRRNDEASEIFLENSARDGLHRLRLPSTTLPSTVQQRAAVRGRHGRRGIFMTVRLLMMIDDQQ